MSGDAGLIEAIHERLVGLEAFIDLRPDRVHVQALQTLPHSEVYRVRTEAPSARLILKRPGATDVAGLAARERRFYRHIAPQLPVGLVPRCILASDEGESGWLFIEDLSGTHHPPRNSLPDRGECRCFVRALAALHGVTAADSGIQPLWPSVAGGLPAATLEQRIDFFATALDPFITMLGSRVDRQARRFLSGLRELDGQLREVGPFSLLVHGDAHFANGLYSPAPRACLIDWGMPMLGFGEIDLAHALGLNLPRRLAAAWHTELVNEYLAERAACGPSLEWHTFRQRYLLGVQYAFTHPVAWWRSGLPEAVWQPALRNALDAARDLKLLS